MLKPGFSPRRSQVEPLGSGKIFFPLLGSKQSWRIFAAHSFLLLRGRSTCFLPPNRVFFQVFKYRFNRNHNFPQCYILWSGCSVSIGDATPPFHSLFYYNLMVAPPVRLAVRGFFISLCFFHFLIILFGVFPRQQRKSKLPETIIGVVSKPAMDTDSSARPTMKNAGRKMPGILPVLVRYIAVAWIGHVCNRSHWPNSIRT